MSMCRCGRIYSGEMREVHFKFRNLVICKHESGLMCDECSIDSFEREFKKYAEECIAIEDGKVSIDWDRLLSLNKEGPRCNMILWLLTDLGKLSSQYQGNWSVGIGYSNTNPRIMDCRIKLYFVDRRDAMDYASHAFSGTGGYEIYRT